MTRTLVRYRCNGCAYESAKWLGRCPDCGEWGSLEAQGGTTARVNRGDPGTQPVALVDVDPLGAPRRATNVPELDRVLGGGLVAGSVTLVGGEPGMGKSTLVLQALGAMAADGARCLLVCAEESAAQVRLRAGRLGTLAPDLLVVCETSLPDVCAHAEAMRPDVIAIDSIQAVQDPDAPGGPGSVSQVRDGAARAQRLAKDLGIATLLVGHVTKDGSLAGPRTLEHVVDTVLSFEGDRHHALRMLRALKHRFGPTDELGLMEMTGDGLVPVSDPSALFLADRRVDASGSVVAAVLEGSRPLCVEVQALVVSTPAPMPRRVAQSFDGGRLAMIVAIVQQRGGVALAGQDIFASVAGGVKVAEPGADLALALAITSAQADVGVAAKTVVIGEVGLGGEVRQVPQIGRRLAEAERLGFVRAIVPASTPDVPGIELARVSDLEHARSVAGLG
jgi:DNA repair protein RadA/Sms